jgi:hypothetical protein
MMPGTWGEAPITNAAAAGRLLDDANLRPNMTAPSVLVEASKARATLALADALDRLVSEVRGIMRAAVVEGAADDLDAVGEPPRLHAAVVTFDPVTGAYPVRPAVRFGESVWWRGPVPPPIGGQYAVEGLDEWGRS